MRFARKHAAFNDVIEITLRGGGKLTRDGTVVSVLDFPADTVFFYIHHIGGLFIKVGTLYNLAVEAENGSGAGAEFAAENTEFAIVHISDGKVPAVRLVSILRCLGRLIGNGAGHGGRFVFLIFGFVAYAVSVVTGGKNGNRHNERDKRTDAFFHGVLPHILFVSTIIQCNHLFVNRKIFSH